MRHAIYMARHGDLTEAIARLFEHFRGKFNRSPLAAEALLRAGVLSAAPKVNNFKQARNWFAHLSQKHPGTQEALAADFYSATLAWRARDWSEAEKLHKAFAAKYPDSPLTLVALDERLPVIAKKSLAVPQASGIDRENTVFVEPGSRKRSAFPIIKETAYNACLNISSKWEMAKSEIIDEDSRRGTILWTGPEIVSATLHRYHLSNAYSSEEYVMVQGSFKTPTGGGGQGGVSVAPFRVTVPSVDVDWVGFEEIGDEVQEETRFVIVPANTNKLDDIRRLLLRDPYDDDERLGDRKKKRPTFAHPSRVNPNITLTWNATDAFFLVDGKEVVHSNTIAINGRSIDDKEWPLKYRLELAEPPLPRLSFTITVEGEQTQDGKAIDTIHGRIVNVDLDVDADYNGTINDADEPLEETPGGIVCLSTNSLTPINLKVAPAGLSGKVTLSATEGGNRIRLWQNANRTGEITLPMEWKNGAPIPETLFVEGITNSAAACDVELKLEYDEKPAGQSNPLFKCEDRIRLTVVKIDMVTPAGDPVNSPVDGGDGSGSVPDGANEFTFSAHNPGVLTLQIKARVAPSGIATQINDQVHFTVDGIGSSTMTWDVANPNGKPTASGDDLLATVTFNGLPADNFDFGAKRAYVYFDGSKHAESDFEVFFPKFAINHPGEQPNHPNWYFYWSQTSANKANTKMVYTDITRSYYDYFASRTIFVANDAALSQIAAWGTPKGIDCFAWTTAHEAKHHAQLTGFWPTNWVAADDIDSDWLPNKQETNYMPRRAYSPTNSATFPDTIGYGQNPIPDVEDINMRSQVGPYGLDQLWTNGSTDNEDWANPGKQTATTY